MRVFIEADKIKIRREGIFLCLDGSNWSYLWPRLYEFLQAQAKNFDVPFKIGLLSWNKEFDRPPSKEFLSSKNISKRGRFITPLVEDVFSCLKEMEYDLITLFEKEPYDWTDWQDELKSRFNKIYPLDSKELEQKTQVEIEEELLGSVFDFKIGELSLWLEDGLPYEFPPGFKVNIEQARPVLTKSFDSHRADIELKTYGVKEEANIMLNLGKRGTFTLCFRNTQPDPASIDNEFNDQKKQIFLNSMKDYKKGIFEHHCPLCGKPHKFTRAFLCNKQKDTARLFAQESIIFKEIDKRRDKSEYVVLKLDSDKICWQIFSLPIIYIEHKGFIVVPDKGNIYFLKISDKLEIFELKKIHRGLYYYPPEEIYILR